VIDIFTASPWPGLVLWTGLYISDYALTIACARMYQSGVRQHICFDGSYEITPYYQPDVDALRAVSPRFLVALVVSLLLVSALWSATAAGDFGSEMYQVALGGMILLELAIHVRHLRNYHLFRAVLAGRALTGRIEYARAATLAHSAVELGAFAAIYAVVSAITGSWFVAGGALACAMLAIKHRVMAGQQDIAAGHPVRIE
jgi:hypothetical protein